MSAEFRTPTYYITSNILFQLSSASQLHRHLHSSVTRRGVTMWLLHQGLRQGGLGRSTTSSSSFFSLLGSSIRTRLSSTNLSSYQHQTQVFPWRHDASLPDRVLQHNDFSGAFNPTARDPPILRKLIAARELNISAWDVLPIPFYKHDWEIQLALNFAVAFEFAIGELLGTVFRGMCNYIISCQRYEMNLRVVDTHFC